MSGNLISLASELVYFSLIFINNKHKLYLLHNKHKDKVMEIKELWILFISLLIDSIKWLSKMKIFKNLPSFKTFIPVLGIKKLIFSRFNNNRIIPSEYSHLTHQEGNILVKGDKESTHLTELIILQTLTHFLLQMKHKVQHRY